MRQGHPLKGPCQEGKLILGEKFIFSLIPVVSSTQHLYLCRGFFRISVTVFAVRVTHQDQEMALLFLCPFSNKRHFVAELQNDAYSESSVFGGIFYQFTIRSSSCFWIFWRIACYVSSWNEFFSISLQNTTFPKQIINSTLYRRYDRICFSRVYLVDRARRFGAQLVN